MTGRSSTSSPIWRRRSSRSPEPRRTRLLGAARLIERSPSDICRIVAAAVVAATVFAIGARAEPYVPASDEMVLEQLPAPGDPRVGATRRLKDELDRRPADQALALQLARRYLDLGRAEGDTRYLGLAQGVLAPWWDDQEPPSALRLARAAVLRSQHHFAAALAELDALVARDPNHAQAQLDRANLLEIMGQAREAETACFHVMRLGASLAGQACLASAGSLSGLARASYADLLATLEIETTAEPAVRAWARTILGEIAARLGDAAAAERHFRAALDLGQPDLYLLATYADLLLDQGRPAAVLDLLGQQRLSDVLLLRRALARLALRDPGVAEDARKLRERFQAVRRRGDVPHLREEARFVLAFEQDAGRALQLASENWDSQRAPADARILLEAAAAAGQPAAAAPALAWIEASRIEDVVLARLAAELEELSS